MTDYIGGDPNTISNSLAMGEAGSDYLDDTNTHSGKWGAILILEDATSFTTLTTTNVYKNSGSLMTASDWGSFEKGDIIRGEFTSIKIASGKIQAMKKYPIGG